MKDVQALMGKKNIVVQNAQGLSMSDESITVTNEKKQPTAAVLRSHAAGVHTTLPLILSFSLSEY